MNHDEIAYDYRLTLSLPSKQLRFVEDRKSESSDFTVINVFLMGLEWVFLRTTPQLIPSAGVG